MKSTAASHTNHQQRRLARCFRHSPLVRGRRVPEAVPGAPVRGREADLGGSPPELASNCRAAAAAAWPCSDAVPPRVSGRPSLISLEPVRTASHVRYSTAAAAGGSSSTSCSAASSDALRGTGSLAPSSACGPSFAQTSDASASASASCGVPGPCTWAQKGFLFDKYLSTVACKCLVRAMAGWLAGWWVDVNRSAPPLGRTHGVPCDR